MAELNSVAANEMDMIGEVSPIVIMVTVPTSLSFLVDPNDPINKLIVTPFTVVNNTNAPVDFNFLGFKANGDSPRLVSYDKYTKNKWSNLTKSQSSKEIALG
jgi:hypothetical protein